MGPFKVKSCLEELSRLEWYVCIAVVNSMIPVIALLAFKERLPLLSRCLRKEEMEYLQETGFSLSVCNAQLHPC